MLTSVHALAARGRAAGFLFGWLAGVHQFLLNPLWLILLPLALPANTPYTLDITVPPMAHACCSLRRASH
jgi:hypothetical protein